MSTCVWIAPAAAPSGPAWTTYRRMASRTGCPSAPSCSACWSSFRLTGLFLHYSKNEDKRDFFWVAQGGTPSLHRRRGRGGGGGRPPGGGVFFFFFFFFVGCVFFFVVFFV